MRAVQAVPVTGAIALMAMGASLAATVGLGRAGWIVGIACGVVMTVALARGAVRYGHYRLGPADWVTLVRATLAVGVGTLVADSFDVSAHVALLVTLAAVALVLDSVDGWVARRSRTASALGAKARRRGRRVPDPRPQHLRRPLGRRLGPLDRRRALRVLRGRLVVAVDAGGAAAALLAKGGRRDPGHRADDCGRGFPPVASDQGRPRRRACAPRGVLRPGRVVALGSPA